MTLKIKRNLPLVLFLIAFLAFLVVAMGGQHIAAYAISI